MINRVAIQIYEIKLFFRRKPLQHNNLKFYSNFLFIFGTRILLPTQKGGRGRGVPPE